MDRRQYKTRQAIIEAFISLLSIKSYNKIIVQDIIDRANIGRATFYAHFETKDELLKTLCEELFGHIISTAKDFHHSNKTDMSLFCHLLTHLKENDNNILGLLSCENSDIFLRYFKDSLNDLIKKEYLLKISDDIDRDFIINHISSSFVEMVLWWLRNGMQKEPEELDYYFSYVMKDIISANN